MEIKFAETMKNLRKDRGNTQEELASHLKISVQAVSKWERGDGMPDIMLLPHIAAFYGTTVDFLLGCDPVRKQEKINDFVKTHNELHAQGKTAERLKLCENMQKIYPNDETVRYYLMRALQNGYIDERFDDIVMLGEQLLKSTNAEYKTGAIRGLCFTYLHKGDRKKALRYAKMMPPAQDLYLHVLEGDELVEHCQNYFWKVCDQMYLYMSYLLKCNSTGYTHEDAHTAWKKLYDIFYVIFSDGDFGFWEDRLARICFFMSMESMKTERLERAMEELEQMLNHIEAFNKFTVIDHTSLLVNKIKTDQSNVAKKDEETLAQSYLKYLNNKEESVFAPIEGNGKYKSIKERLSYL